MSSQSSNAYPVVPRVGVGAITVKEGKILLVKRGIEPSKGLWAIPGGTLKLGETLQECAAREILEETGIKIKVGECIYVFDFIELDKKKKIKFHFVIADFAADYISGEPQGADDALEARWLSRLELRDLPVAENTLAALRTVGFLIS
ncbi:MAG: NUDIX hydrolase [Deltaproteobacteria bacterium HGW-Deltaproteobacteria-7]|jgi:ADP-ribose pyrophosphatase|nr:MAG: NUDIX hydrolase [Deltaproteobacteria bacterium HGW-Deltaproteobacteria-7]PKN52564.1 MAG: NUDIX hydrolase [Deltaproteobacteria bacterium HGW-Deltaproteobacteria-13]